MTDRMMHHYRTVLGLGDVAYHVLDGEGAKGLVTGVLFRPTGVLYYVTWADGSERCCYELELSREPVLDFGATS